MRRARCTHGPLARRAGFSLIEMTIAFTVMTIILVATSAILRRETRGINELQNMGHAEKVMETAFARILRTVQFARGFSPETTLTSTLTGAETGTARLSDITGFPDSGVFVVDLGDPTEEIVAYSGTSAADDQLLDLERPSGVITAGDLRRVVATVVFEAMDDMDPEFLRMIEAEWGVIFY